MALAGPTAWAYGAKRGEAEDGVSVMRRGIAVGASVALVAVFAPVGVVAGGPPAQAAPRAAMPFDFDGDGYADLAVGVPGEDLGSRAVKRDAGSVQVLYGSSRGPTARDQLWTQDSRGIKGAAERGDMFGEVLASGDFDADGYADLAVGVPSEGVGLEDWSGVVQVLYGGPKGLTARDQLWRQGKAGVPGTPAEGNGFGRFLAAGDFDGDGYADLAIAADRGLPQVEPIESMPFSKGHLVVLRGSASGLTSAGLQSWSVDTPGLVLPAVCTTALEGFPEIDTCSIGAFARSLAAGDVNGDGRDDLAFLAPSGPAYGPFTSWAWAMLVLPGSPTGLTTSGQQLLTVADMGDYLEFTSTGGRLPGDDVRGPAAEWDDIALADFNGDKLDDLVVGDRARNGQRAGGIAVLYAGRSGFAPGAKQVWYPDRRTGTGVIDYSFDRDCLTAGDLNGDGFAELVVGWSDRPFQHSSTGFVRPTYPPMLGGTVYVLNGSASGLAGAWTVLTQDTAGIPGVAEPEDSFGASVAVLPFAGGATEWMAVGSPGEALGRLTDAGRVVVIPGSSGGVVPTSSRSWHQNSRGIQGVAESAGGFDLAFADMFGASVGAR